MPDINIGQLYKANKKIELQHVTIEKDELCTVARTSGSKHVLVNVKNEYVCDVNSIMFKHSFEIL